MPTHSDTGSGPTVPTYPADPTSSFLVGARSSSSRAGSERIVILVLDGAGWHTEPGLVVPEGIRLVYLPRYTPELQPAETLWVHVDEPIANNHFETLAELDAVVGTQCVALHKDRDRVKGQAGFHWWPEPVSPA